MKVRSFAGGAAACLLLGALIKLTAGLLRDHDVRVVDEFLLDGVARFRTHAFTDAVVRFTDLGSNAALGGITAGAIVLFIVWKRAPWDALQLLLASSGAGICVNVGKHFVARSRPGAQHALIKSIGYSFPSGHALSSAAIYLTLALCVGRRIRSPRWRAAVFAAAGMLIFAIGLSRVYLGVHFPSDVFSGILLGLSWALFLEMARRHYDSKSLPGRGPT
jgi:undecaprenyl-diphosphatase